MSPPTHNLGVQTITRFSAKINMKQFVLLMDVKYPLFIVGILGSYTWYPKNND